MAVLFIVIPEGTEVKIECCDKCNMPVINKSKIDFESVFYGSHGEPAKFCSDVVNVKYGPSLKTNMATGCYYIQVVTCKRCETELGWFYEFAYNPSER